MWTNQTFTERCQWSTLRGRYTVSKNKKGLSYWCEIFSHHFLWKTLAISTYSKHCFVFKIHMSIYLWTHGRPMDRLLEGDVTKHYLWGMALWHPSLTFLSYCNHTKKKKNQLIFKGEIMALFQGKHAVSFKKENFIKCNFHHRI